MSAPMRVALQVGALLLLDLYGDCGVYSSPVECEPVGGCILSIPSEDNVPSDPYIVSDITASPGGGASCSPFSKGLRAYGLLMLAGTDSQDVPDNGIKWVAHAVTELFPQSASDRMGQKKILEAMFRYRAAVPIFVGSMVDKMSPARDYLSMCDTITIGMEDSAGNPSSQILEVYEHLLHAITDVGLHHAHPKTWGITKGSQLYAAMQEAIDVGVYDVSDYQHIDEEDVRTRIEMQEFAFWALSTVQGVHAAHFEGSAEPEWSLVYPHQVKNQIPKFWALHQATTENWLGNISNATMTQLGKLAPGGTADFAPWPISGQGVDKIPTGVCDRLPESACGPRSAASQPGAGAVMSLAATSWISVYILNVIC